MDENTRAAALEACREGIKRCEKMEDKGAQYVWVGVYLTAFFLGASLYFAAIALPLAVAMGLCNAFLARRTLDWRESRQEWIRFFHEVSAL